MLSHADGDSTTASGSDDDVEIVKVVAVTAAAAPEPSSQHPRDSIDWHGGKIEGTDDSDSLSAHRKRAKLNPKAPSRRGRKRRRTANLPDQDGKLRAYASRGQDDAIPHFIRERRREFDEARQILGDAGLRLP